MMFDYYTKNFYTNNMENLGYTLDDNLIAYKTLGNKDTDIIITFNPYEEYCTAIAITSNCNIGKDSITIKISEIISNEWEKFKNLNITYKNDHKANIIIFYKKITK